MSSQTPSHDARPVRLDELVEASEERGSDVAAIGVLWLVPVLGLLVALTRL